MTYGNYDCRLTEDEIQQLKALLYQDELKYIFPDRNHRLSRSEIKRGINQLTARLANFYPERSENLIRSLKYSVNYKISKDFKEQKRKIVYSEWPKYAIEVLDDIEEWSREHKRIS